MYKHVAAPRDWKLLLMLDQARTTRVFATPGPDPEAKE